MHPRKTIAKLWMVLLVLTISISIDAKPGNDYHDTIRITGTRFTYPLFTKWINEYNRQYPKVVFILKSGISADSADIQIMSHVLSQGDIKAGKTSVAVAGFVQLPIANSSRKDLDSLHKTGLSHEELKQVYFTNQESGTLPLAYDFTVYTRDKPTCSAISFANHFGSQSKDIKGTQFEGDDKEMLEAVKKDPNGVSYNNLGLIYNLQTRKVNNNIAVIPIDLNGNGIVDSAENIYNSLDEVIAFTEKTGNDEIPAENVNVIYKAHQNKKAVYDFLEWVLRDGQQYNHAYGFLNMADIKIEDQLAWLSASASVDTVDLDAVYGKEN